MGHVTLTIAEIRWPAEGKDRGGVVGADGRKFGCFREKLGLFAVGNTYEIEVTDGQYQNVKSARLVAADAPSRQQAAPAPQANGSGNGYYRPTSPEDSERMFVCATLGALIRAGEVKNDKGQLFHTTQMLRLIWQHTFGAQGAGGAFHAGENAQRAQA